MTELQKDLINTIVKTILSITGGILFLIACYKYEIFGAIVMIMLVLGLAAFIVGGLIYLIASSLVKDYKIRGVLTKGEYDLYSESKSHNSILWLTEHELNEVDKIQEKIDRSIKHK